ncbi:hypothetical protein [Streptomyces sp. NPDC001809]
MSSGKYSATPPPPVSPARDDLLLLSEPYECWQALAAGLLDVPVHGRRMRGVYVSRTRLMRTAPHSLWVQLRQLLSERGLVPAGSVLVELMRSGHDTEFGVVISDGGRVYDFELRYVRARGDTEEIVLMAFWHDITDRWQATPFSTEIADAFLWHAPPRRTVLTAGAT